MGTNEFYYNNEKKITREEAHALKDKSGLVVADVEQTFEKENKVMTTPGYPKPITAKKGGKKNVNN